MDQAFCNHYRAGDLYTDTINIEELPFEQEAKVSTCKSGHHVLPGEEWTPCQKGLASMRNSTPTFGYGARPGVGYGRWYLKTRGEAPYVGGEAPYVGGKKLLHRLCRSR